MCIERSLSEPSDGFEDLVGGFRPHERLGFVVVSIEIVLYRIAELRHARVRAPPQGVFGEQSKEALSEVEPRGVCGREVKVEPRSLGEPTFDRRRLVRGEIVEPSRIAGYASRSKTPAPQVNESPMHRTRRESVPRGRSSGPRIPAELVAILTEKSRCSETPSKLGEGHESYVRIGLIQPFGMRREDLWMKPP